EAESLARHAEPFVAGEGLDRGGRRPFGNSSCFAALSMTRGSMPRMADGQELRRARSLATEQRCEDAERMADIDTFIGRAAELLELEPHLHRLCRSSAAHRPEPIGLRGPED